MNTFQRFKNVINPPTREILLPGKVALITGGADGIGLATATCLHEEGVKIVIVDRDQGAAERAANRFGEQKSLAICADVTDRAAMRAAVETVIAKFGRLDIVVANAGITPVPSTLRTCKLDDFDRVMAVNLTGVLNTIHPAIEELIRCQGHIVVVSSVAAFSPPMCAASYMVSKAGVEQLGRALKLELAQHGVTTTVSYFGVVDTTLVKNGIDKDPLGQKINQQLPPFWRKRVTPRRAGEVITEGIKTRAEITIEPASWGVLSMLRGMANPVLDRLIVNDPEIQEFVVELEKR